MISYSSVEECEKCFCGKFVPKVDASNITHDSDGIIGANNTVLVLATVLLLC